VDWTREYVSVFVAGGPGPDTLGPPMAASRKGRPPPDGSIAGPLSDQGDVHSNIPSGRPCGNRRP